MHILNLSTDRAILKSGSRPAERMIGYGGLCDSYTLIVAGSDAGIQPVKLSENVITYGVGGNRPMALIKMLISGFKICRQRKIDVITVQDPFELAIVGYLLKLYFGISLNIQEHGDFFSQNYWRKENPLNFCRYYLGRLMLTRADSIRAVSDRIKKNMVERFGIPADKIIVVPVYVETGCQSTAAKPEIFSQLAGKKVFVTMARLVKQKNLLLLIEAFRLAAAKIPEAVLLIIGCGSEKEKLAEAIKECGLGNRIFMIDWTDNVNGYYQSADAYVLSSDYEGWGMVIIEAASCGLPILMTDVGCAGQVIKNNESGLVAPVRDAQALADGLITLSNDDELRNRLAVSAASAIAQVADRQGNLSLYAESWSLAKKNYSERFSLDQFMKTSQEQSGQGLLIWQKKIKDYLRENWRELSIVSGVVLVNILIRALIVHFQADSDGYQYMESGKFLWNQGVEMYSFRLLKPMAPWLMGLIAALSGVSYQTAFVIEVFIFYFLLGWMSYVFFRYFFMDSKKALIGAMLYLTAYPVIKYGLNLYTETCGWFFWVLSAYLSLVYFKEKRCFNANIIAIIVGIMFKEYSFVAFLLFLMVIFFHPRLTGKEKIIKLAKAISIVVLFLAIWQLFTFYNFNVTYFYIYHISGSLGLGTDHYVLPDIAKSIFATFGLGWLLALFGLKNFNLISSKGQKIFIALMVLPSFLFLLWGGVSSRLYYVVALLLVILSLVGISEKTLKSWYFYGALAVITVFNYYWLFI